jgi:hypothetical protein
MTRQDDPATPQTLTLEGFRPAARCFLFQTGGRKRHAPLLDRRTRSPASSCEAELAAALRQTQSAARANLSLMASEFSKAQEPTLGRVLLLIGAYAPVALIIAARVIPNGVGWAALGVGLAGVGGWLAFLWWVPGRQTRTVEIDDFDLVDTEVTAYIVSLLLPVVVAIKPDTGDLIAYGLCAALILFVAYVADLAAFNPFVYLFGYRVGRGTIEGEPSIILSRNPRSTRGDVEIVRAIGVTVIVEAVTEET